MLRFRFNCFIRLLLLTLLIVSLFTSFADVSVALAEPYFCRTPLVQRLSGAPAFEPKSTPKTFKKLAKYFDPLIFNASMMSLDADQSSINKEFKKLLSDKEKTPSSKSLNTKMVLNFLLGLDETSVGPALAYLCSLEPSLSLKNPHRSERLQKIKIKLVELKKRNSILFRQFLEDHFPVNAPSSIYSEDIGTFIGQVKTLDVLLRWSDSSVDFPKRNQVNELRQYTRSLSQQYNQEISKSVEDYVEEKRQQIEEFIVNVTAQLEDFESQKLDFSERLARYSERYSQALTASVPSDHGQDYLTFRRNLRTRALLIGIEESFLWRQSVRVLSSNNGTIGKLYLSFFSEATAFAKDLKVGELDENLPKVPEGIRPLNFDFAQSSLLDLIFSIDEDEIILFPWYRFPSRNPQLVDWNNYSCQINRLNSNQLKVFCKAKTGYLGDRERLITIAREHEYGALVFFLNRVFNHEAETEAYINIAESSYEEGQTFLKMMRSLAILDDRRQLMQKASRWGENQSRSQERGLSRIVSLLKMVQLIHIKIHKYVNMAVRKSKHNEYEFPRHLTRVSYLNHLDTLATLLRNELEADVFSTSKLSKQTKLELWNNAAFTFYETVIQQCPFELRAEDGSVKTTLRGNVKYQILVALGLHNIEAPTVEKGVERYDKVEKLALKLHSLIRHEEKKRNLYKKYIIHSLERFAEFFLLKPASENPLLNEFLTQLPFQISDLYKLIKGTVDGIELQDKDPIEEFRRFQSDIRDFKRVLLDHVISKIDGSPSYQLVMKRIAAREMNGLFEDRSHLIRLMAYVNRIDPPRGCRKGH